MSIQDLIGNLPPAVRKWAVLAAAAAGVLVLAATVVLFGDATPRNPADRRQQLVSNLLTDSDPRGMGVEALAQRVRESEETIRRLTAQLGAVRPAQQPGPDNVALEALRQEHALEIGRLQADQAQLRAQLDGLEQAPPNAARVPALPPPEVHTTPPALPAPQPLPPAERPLSQIFKTPPSMASAMAPKAPARAMEIRVVTAAASPGTAKASATARDATSIPAGSIIRAVFLSGLDAPTGRQARRDPYPVLARIKREAILPNLFTADVSECFLILSGYGDLGSERAYLRTEAISCVRRDGGAIEVPVDGYAVGEDGKAGVRGRVVSKQGAAIARAMQVSFLQGFSQVFNQNPVASISTSPGTSQPYQSVLSPQALQAGAIGGTGKALDRLANYFMDMAEDMFPVIEIDAGRAVEVILNKGASLRLANQTQRSRG